MSENKTQPNDADVGQFIASIENDRRREDAATLLKLFGDTTGFEPRMWGDSIVGYGRYRYAYKSGRTGEFFMTGFSPRKSASTIYVMPGFKNYAKELKRLGPHKHSVSCLYVTRLDKIDIEVLSSIVEDSVARMKTISPEWWPR